MPDKSSDVFEAGGTRTAVATLVDILFVRVRGRFGNADGG
jgi:hypothetical protein